MDEAAINQEVVAELMPDVGNQDDEPEFVAEDEPPEYISNQAIQLRNQLERLQAMPSTTEWNSITKFLEKSKLLDSVEKSSEVANKRALNSKVSPNPLQ